MSIAATHPAARVALQWFANAVPGVPIRAALRANVTGLRWEDELGGGVIMTLITDNEIAAKSLMRRHGDLFAAAVRGYREQVDITITALNIHP